MSITDLLKRKKPSNEELNKEALKASELMEMAINSDDNTDYLRQFVSLVKNSSQSDIYELNDVQDIIADKVVKKLFENYNTNSLLRTEYFDKTYVCSPIEKAIKEIISSLGSNYWNLIKNEECVKLANEKARKVIILNLTEIAETIFNANQEKIFFEDDLIPKYEMIKEVYKGNFKEEFPTVTLKSTPEDSEGTKTSLDHIIYPCTIVQNIRRLGFRLSKIKPLGYHLDSTNKQEIESFIKNKLQNIQYCVSKVEHNKEEIGVLNNNIHNILGPFKQNIADAERYILKRQDYFEDRMDSFYEQEDFSKAANELHKELRFVEKYETILEETVEQATERILKSKPLITEYFNKKKSNCFQLSDTFCYDDYGLSIPIIIKVDE